MFGIWGILYKECYNPHHMNRREFLKLTGAAAAGLLSQECIGLLQQAMRRERPRLKEKLESNSMLFGVSPHKNRTKHAQETAKLLNVPLGIANYFIDIWKPPTPGYLASLVQTNAEANIITMLSWQSDATSLYQPPTVIKNIAEALAQTHTNLLFRPWYEMNGREWSPVGSRYLTPTEFCAGWQRTHDLFRQVGADNVQFVFSPNVTTYAESIPQYYPGDAYVDQVALDAYEKSATTYWPPSMSAEQVLGPDIATLQEIAPAKPFFLAEVNAIRNPTFVREAIQFAAQSGARAAVIFDWDKHDVGYGEVDWTVRSSPELQSALLSYLQSDHIVHDSLTFHEKFALLQ